MTNVRLNEVLEVLDRIAPFNLAENWDNVGLLVGDPGREVRRILLGLDPTLTLLEEAVARDADCLITHHPCIFRPLPVVNPATPDGAFLERALTTRLGVIACHTNLDNAAEGVSDALAGRLGLQGLRPLLPTPLPAMSGAGTGRVGELRPALSFAEFLQLLFGALAVSGLQIAGPPPEEVGTVALCGGSGSEFAEKARQEGADVYLSAEIKHSTARWAEAAGFCIIDGTHYATELPAMSLLEARLQEVARERDWDVEILLAASEKPAFTFVAREDCSTIEKPETGE